MVRQISALSLAIFFCGVVFAETKPDVKTDTKKADAKTDTATADSTPSRLVFDAGAGINLLSYPAGITNTDDRITPVFSAKANYFFTDVIGAFAGLDTSTRGFQNLYSGNASTARFVDVPFGLVINPKNSLESIMRPLIRVGGYYAIPVNSDFTGVNDLSNIGTQTQSYFGLYIDHQMTWAVSKSFAIGYDVWGKIPLGSGLAQTSAKFYEAGVGFVVELR